MDRKLTIVLGAGASKDVFNGNTSEPGGRWEPPLAKDLFALDTRQGFEFIIKDYPGAHIIASLVRPRLGMRKENLEDVLLNLAQQSKVDSDLRNHFVEVPLYIHNVIRNCSTLWLDSTPPGCYVHLSYKVFTGNRHKVLFVVLNYDTLLETALTKYKRESYIDYDDQSDSRFDQYVDPGRYAMVVKLHGSIDWFRALAPRNRYPDIGEAIRNSGVTPDLPERPSLLFKDLASRKEERLRGYYIQRVEGEEYWIYPCVTVPIAEKDPQHVLCPESHIAMLKDFVQGCTKFLFVGTSGLDKDLMFYLSRSIQQVDKLHFVGRDDGGADKSTIEAFDRFREGIPKIGQFINPKIFTGGFRKYMEAELIDDLLED